MCIRRTSQVKRRLGRPDPGRRQAEIILAPCVTYDTSYTRPRFFHTDFQEPMRIYLAGPDVFLANAREVGARKAELCAQRGFTGLCPLDSELREGDDPPSGIFRANCALMESADAGLFNLTPFRGPSADVGTAFELGFLFARKKPVFGYSSDPARYLERVRRSFGPIRDIGGRPADRDGFLIENFGLVDNLMLVRSIADCDGELVIVPESGEDRLAAFGAFTLCLDRLEARASRARGLEREGA
jgi:nucleoside 2-deoxyribosyltransferase